MSCLVNLLVKKDFCYQNDKSANIEKFIECILLTRKKLGFHLQEFYKKIEREDMYIRFVNFICYSKTPLIKRPPS